MKIFEDPRVMATESKHSHFVQKCSSAGKTLDVLISKQNKQIRNCQKELKQKQTQKIKSRTNLKEGANLSQRFLTTTLKKALSSRELESSNSKNSNTTEKLYVGN